MFLPVFLHRLFIVRITTVLSSFPSSKQDHRKLDIMEHHRTSRLLGLLRELRDMIYDNLPDPARPLSKPSQTRLKASPQTAPMPRVRLINNQIKDEYDPRTKLWTTLLIADHKYFDFSTIRLAKLPAAIRSTSFQVFAICDECDDMRRSP